MSTDQGSTMLEPVDEAAREEAIKAFKSKMAPTPEPEAQEIRKAPPGSVTEKMIVGIVWKTQDGKTWIAPGMYVVRGVRKNGSRVNLKLIKKR